MSAGDNAHAVEMDVLITVKAYPNPSTKYTETVCVAGIRVDIEPHEWVRLYPVPFRLLPKELQFKKYDIVRLRAVKPRSDSRPESYSPIHDSVKVIDYIARGSNWDERMPILKAVEIGSMCELKQLQAYNGTSLGFFKPHEILDFTVTPTRANWDDGQMATLGQGNLFCEVRPTLEKIPYDFRYVYRCDESSCNGHEMLMIDWELAQLYRRTNYMKSETERLQAVRTRWLDEICSEKRDTYFYAGNMAAHHGSFVLLGAAYPRKTRVREPAPQMARLF
jgi:hypothetical protein